MAIEDEIKIRAQAGRVRVSPDLYQQQLSTQQRLATLPSPAMDAQALRAAPSAPSIADGISTQQRLSPKVAPPIDPAKLRAGPSAAAQAEASALQQRMTPKVAPPMDVSSMRKGPGPQAQLEADALQQRLKSGRPGVPAPKPNAPLVNATPAQQIAQRLATIQGEPYRDPRSWFNRPINPQPAMDAMGRAAGRGAGALDKASGIGGKLAPVVGMAVEGARTLNDVVTPGMTGLDQTARVAEGAGRFGAGMAGMAGGAALGAMTGPLAPLAVPALGIAGGVAGALAPEAVNWAANKVAGLFGGPTENQLPSQRAAQLQASAQSAPSQVAPQAPAPAAPEQAPPNQAAAAPASKPNVGAAARPAPTAAPAAPLTTGARRQDRPAPAPVAAAAPLAAPGIGAALPPPLQNVAYTALGGVNRQPAATPVLPMGLTMEQAMAELAKYPQAPDPKGAMVAFNDGSRSYADEALKTMGAMNAHLAQNPVADTPVEVIRGMNKTMAVPQLGYAEMDAGRYQAAADNGGIGQLTAAMAQGDIDAQAPEQARQSRELALQGLHNEGAAANAGIAAGPHYAQVTAGQQEAANRLAHERTLAENTVVGGSVTKTKNIDGSETVEHNPMTRINKLTGKAERVQIEGDDSARESLLKQYPKLKVGAPYKGKDGTFPLPGGVQVTVQGGKITEIK